MKADFQGNELEAPLHKRYYKLNSILPSKTLTLYLNVFEERVFQKVN